jgi:hypothetical protein
MVKKNLTHLYSGELRNLCLSCNIVKNGVVKERGREYGTD